MKLLATLAIYAGGQGSGCNPHKGRCGRPSSRATRAKTSHVPATAEKQRKAEANEGVLAQKINGKTTGDNKPFDVMTVIRGKKIGIEVKTIEEGKNDKITMHPASKVRKERAGRKLDGIYTVVFDNRNGKNDIYMKQGVGSFRLGSMQKVPSIDAVLDNLK